MMVDGSTALPSWKSQEITGDVCVLRFNCSSGTHSNIIPNLVTLTHLPAEETLMEGRPRTVVEEGVQALLKLALQDPIQHESVFITPCEKSVLAHVYLPPGLF